MIVVTILISYIFAIYGLYKGTLDLFMPSLLLITFSLAERGIRWK